MSPHPHSLPKPKSKQPHLPLHVHQLHQLYPV